ncbi:MAG: PEP-CTERM sorting domain-containing protein [Burkholderiales bacterium]|nr:PEP-CTERM sorting domain-containing protein [Burkholderiales bacterium]
MRHAICLLAALLALGSAGANAAIITYADRGAFIAATGAVPIGAIPASVPSGGFSLGGLTFSNHSPSSFNSSVNWSTLISEANDLALNGDEEFNIDAAGPLFAFGFDFHEPSLSTPPGPTFPDTCNTACVDSTFTVTLLAGAVVVDAFAFNRPDDVLAFVGVASTTAFDRIEIRESGTADNEFFGNFLISRTAIPEPATIALLGIALAGLGCAGRHRRP